MLMVINVITSHARYLETNLVSYDVSIVSDTCARGQDSMPTGATKFFSAII